MPVLLTDTGHYYEHISGVFNWADAQSDAQARTFNGVHGYLATVTSSVENAFLGILANDGWLGGSDQAIEGTWVWADGPEAGTVFWQGGVGGSSPTYASWGGGEPNNLGDEDYLHYSGGTWNDLSINNQSFGYFVEFDPPSGNAPAPLTLSLLVLGMLGLRLSSRRSR